MDYTKTNAFDRTVMSLCSEIDVLQAEVEYWKELYEQEKLSNAKMLNENLINAKQGVANALRFALACSDDEHGNLVINRENRKDLAESIKTDS